jgi:hypothetical protein
VGFVVNNVRRRFPRVTLFPEPLSPLRISRLQGLSQENDALIVDALEGHVASDSVAYFAESRSVGWIVCRGELVCFTAESVDVESERIPNARPWCIDRDSFAETRDDCVVRDRGESDQVGTRSGNARRLGSHSLCVNQASDDERVKKKKKKD